MKKTVSLICMLSLMICCFALPANAQTAKPVKEEIIQVFEDGSYLVRTVESNPVMTLATNNRSGQAKMQFKNSAGTVLWVYTLYATFTYDGKNSACNSARYDYEIKNIFWKIYGPGCGTAISGNGAYGDLCFKRYSAIGIELQSVSDCLALYCSPEGELY